MLQSVRAGCFVLLKKGRNKTTHHPVPEVVCSIDVKRQRFIDLLKDPMRSFKRGGYTISPHSPGRR